MEFGLFVYFGVPARRKVHYHPGKLRVKRGAVSSPTNPLSRGPAKY